MKIDRALIRHSTWLLLLVVPCVTAILGCNGGKRTYQVRGKVTYTDGSVPKGTVAVVLFSPVEGSTAEIRKGASGAIEPDGSFEMVTRMPGDGVNAGDYTVSFRIVRVAANGSMTSLVAPKYASPMLSPFKVKVDHNTSDLSYAVEKAEGVAAADTSPVPAGPGSGPGT